MAYLIYKDYQINIQDRVYLQLVAANDTKRTAAEQWAISIVRGKITQKYDVNQEFTPTQPWNPATVYNVRDRVVIDYPAWATLTNYTINVSTVIYNGIGYLCTASNADATFNPAHWVSLGAQYTIYYVGYPPVCTYQSQYNPATLANPYAPEFSLIDIANGGAQRMYNLGDVVFWKGSLYTAVVATCDITDEEIIQYISYKDVPYQNIFPDDKINNNANQFWSVPTPYSVPAGTLPNACPIYAAYNTGSSYAVGATVSYNGAAYQCITATTTPAGAFVPANWALLPNDSYWIQGDNRTPEIMECVKDITIYKLSGLLNFKRAEWDDRYMAACELLKGYANGWATLLMPLKMIPSGTRVRYGGRVKQSNTY